MKTSKIKLVNEVNQYTNDYGVTYYHLIVMENGDKINIGKKKKQLEGWELTYELIGDAGQHEYTKAKSVQKENLPPEQQQKIETKMVESKVKKEEYLKGIEVGHAVNNAVNLLCAGLEFQGIEADNNEDKIKAYARKILGISNDLKQE